MKTAMSRGQRGWLLGTAGALCLLGAGLHRTAQAQSSRPQGKITPWAAMRLANNKVSGKPISATYAFDEGHWMYDVLIANGKNLREVEVDAVTGKAGSAETTTPEAEAKEMIDDLNHALGKATARPAEGAEKGEKGEKD